MANTAVQVGELVVHKKHRRKIFLRVPSIPGNSAINIFCLVTYIFCAEIWQVFHCQIFEANRVENRPYTKTLDLAANAAQETETVRM